MEKITNNYETIFVVDTSIGEEAVAGVVEKFKTMIAKSCSVESVDEWGKRRLAYPIEDRTEGYYTLVNFTAEPDFIKELDRVYNITDGILRTITIKK
ncbi:MAG: 30S ribosomal protein S6 [Ruminococcaceae bacterium]|nr:30S ribosomal protein S6 [Oscillospiraceae bacterium]